MTFIPSFEMTQMSNLGAASADNVLRATIAAAIYTATETGARTTSAITWTSDTEDNMLEIVKELRGNSYTVTLGTGTLTVSWQ